MLKIQELWFKNVYYKPSFYQSSLKIHHDFSLNSFWTNRCNSISNMNVFIYYIKIRLVVIELFGFNRLQVRLFNNCLEYPRFIID